MKKQWVVLVLPLALLAACARGSPEDIDLEPALGTMRSGLCPTPGSCAAIPRYDLSSVPGLMDPGEKYVASVFMENAGPNPWDDAGIRLNSALVPRGFWGTWHEAVDPTILPGQVSVHPIVMRAPTSPGTFPFRYGMRDTTGLRFGAQFSMDIVVVERPRFWDCAHVGVVSPTLAGRANSVALRVRNTGRETWRTDGSFSLCQQDDRFWSRQVCDTLTPAGTSPPGGATVPPGAEATFVTTLNAPSTPGSYALRRQMRDASGVQLFDDDPANACIQVMVDVTLCGNGTLDPGESCDDGNFDASDACGTCVLPGRALDLTAEAADRSFFGGQINRSLANTVIADVGGSARREVIVGENASSSTGISAGRIVAYDGDDFFGGADVVVPAGARWVIEGADTNDHLGGSYAGRFFVADVTHDGVNDVIVSAPDADGVAEGRSAAGEVYVIVGGAAGLTGVINVGTPPAGVLGATFIGAASGDQLRVVAVGDLSGDGRADLALGAPGHSDPAGGVASGAIYVVAGGPGLAAGETVDLASASTLAKVVGSATRDRLGGVTAIGNIIGNGQPDLAVSSRSHDEPGRASCGAAWVLQGPLSGRYELGLAYPNHRYAARFLGEQANDDLGAALAIGNVQGLPGRAELVIGIPQLNDANSDQVGGVDIWTGFLRPPAGDPTFDLGLGARPNARIWGERAGDLTGTSLAIGDSNLDGIGDIFLAAAGGDGPDDLGDRRGELSLVRGTSSATLGTVSLSAVGSAWLRVFGGDDGGLLGSHPQNVAVGDIDGDGRAEVCMGSRNRGPTGGGRVDCFRTN